MELSPSAHLDTFCRDRLPPPDQWPEFRFSLPELSYPDRLNCAAELLDRTAASVGHGRACVRRPGPSCSKHAPGQAASHELGGTCLRCATRQQTV